MTAPHRDAPRRFILGIGGSAGSLYGLRALRMLTAAGLETHLVLTPAAQTEIATDTLAELHALAAAVHRPHDIAAPISSGSFVTAGMLVAPCSAGSLSMIATGVTADLLSRAADVILKERRRLVLLVCETPLHLGHLRAMTQLTEMGAVVMPPVPDLEPAPCRVADLVDRSLGHALGHFPVLAGALTPRSGR